MYSASLRLEVGVSSVMPVHSVVSSLSSSEESSSAGLSRTPFADSIAFFTARTCSCSSFLRSSRIWREKG